MTTGGRALALTRSWPIVGGGSAYIPRGPGPVHGVDAEGLAARLVAIGELLAADGIDVVAADPEVPDAETGVPQRDRGRRVPSDRGDPAVASPDLAAARGPERGRCLRRHIEVDPSADPEGRGDGRVGSSATTAGSRPSGAGEGFDAPSEAAEVALDRFYDLLLQTGERRHFTFGPREPFVAWWRAALEAGHLVYLEAWGDPRSADRRV